MKTIITLLALILLTVVCSAQSQLTGKTEKPRLIVLADMGNEPDEEQQIAHLLMYADKIDIEALIAVSSWHLKPGREHPYRAKLHPELLERLVRGYEQVFPNLLEHNDDWESPYNLRARIASGALEYGMSGVGEGKTTEGSDFIIRIVEREDPRPVIVVSNAGSGTLAQALYDYRKTHSAEALDSFVKKLIVMENGAQDETGAWICHEFPNIHWVRMIIPNRCYGGPTKSKIGPHVWKPYAYSSKGQDEWAHEHIRTYHGPLGELYPMRLYFHLTYNGTGPDFLEGGGIIPWLGLAMHGLTDPAQPSWGGWSGRYTSEKVKNVPSMYEPIVPLEYPFKPWSVYTDAKDQWTDPETDIEYNNAESTVWRWRQAMWDDFRARMDWCLEPFDEANHNPVAAIDGDTTDDIIMKTVKAGETMSFDASASSDPDNNSLSFVWWVYKEAGQNPYGKAIKIAGNTKPKIDLVIPADAAGKELHLILEVWDESPIVPMVDYRRVVIQVR